MDEKDAKPILGTISILPIRNWNEVNKKEDKKESKNFYPTYKELKQWPRGKGFWFGSNFYPTYKELKLSIIKPVDEAATYFYPTYKELKLY